MPILSKEDPSPSIYLGRHDVIHVIKWTMSFPSVLCILQKLNTGKAWEWGYRIPFCWNSVAVCNSMKYISIFSFMIILFAIVCCIWWHWHIHVWPIRTEKILLRLSHEMINCPTVISSSDVWNFTHKITCSGTHNNGLLIWWYIKEFTILQI